MGLYLVKANVQGLRRGEVVDIDGEDDHWRPLIERGFVVAHTPIEVPVITAEDAVPLEVDRPDPTRIIQEDELPGDPTTGEDYPPPPAPMTIAERRAASRGRRGH